MDKQKTEKKKSLWVTMRNKTVDAFESIVASKLATKVFELIIKK